MESVNEQRGAILEKIIGFLCSFGAITEPISLIGEYYSITNTNARDFPLFVQKCDRKNGLEKVDFFRCFLCYSYKCD